MMTKGQRLLAAISGVLCEYDPVGLAAAGHEVDYEIEALSVLARFNETHIGMLRGVEQNQVAMAVVNGVLVLWHGPDAVTPSKVVTVTALLVEAYMAEPA